MSRCNIRNIQQQKLQRRDVRRIVIDYIVKVCRSSIDQNYIYIQVLLKVKVNEDKSFCTCRYYIIMIKRLGIRARQINLSSPVKKLKKEMCLHLEAHKNRSIMDPAVLPWRDSRGKGLKD